MSARRGRRGLAVERRSEKAVENFRFHSLPMKMKRSRLLRQAESSPSPQCAITHIAEMSDRLNRQDFST
ncbi:hypothetical protein RZS28_03180 [Methylocapsa polymorpha]|uniref:Uncharacterized protein n=1 Tax=Methylocapsa polymorpha TaxID=3080828 RepID=A0ABZ0HWP7_9HYPH|nr:hypothetical protein RZS28_03180 [Methylocapsa sp. RX1]